MQLTWQSARFACERYGVRYPASPPYFSFSFSSFLCLLTLFLSFLSLLTFTAQFYQTFYFGVSRVTKNERCESETNLKLQPAKKTDPTSRLGLVLASLLHSSHSPSLSSLSLSLSLFAWSSHSLLRLHFEFAT